MTNDEAKAKLQEMSTIQCRSVLRLLNNSQEEKKFKPTDIASMKTADCKTNILTRYPKDFAGAVAKVLADGPAPKPGKKGTAPAAAKAPKLDDMGFPIEEPAADDTGFGAVSDNTFALIQIDPKDAKVLTDTVADIIKKHTAPLEARIAAIEKLLT